MVEWAKYLICFIIGIIIFKMIGNSFKVSAAEDKLSKNQVTKTLFF